MDLNNTIFELSEDDLSWLQMYIKKINFDYRLHSYIKECSGSEQVGLI